MTNQNLNNRRTDREEKKRRMIKTQSAVANEWNAKVYITEN